ncbi:ADP-ribosylation factor-like protein 2-binding protein isoform X1 [Athalia rosae]|uniref:ADP-ribosylation factor-like protein 2-binding protein isoform X1 n=1 Tax=Athalia rosae TaxID=37344 RepID=UPI00203340C2|nr:ADP-ribosylation factor-like protein 2-binding protein isoform X1 [Athalia rosae]XP_020711095.2 ADP-ribosylation factor-like protein 2-binding protein isoform X1 [Athalia rosae]XP_048508475.1 ADP-ribosylation factor-like protein 2-binding protein isoform X1 [Athalia rosae]
MNQETIDITVMPMDTDVPGIHEGTKDDRDASFDRIIGHIEDLLMGMDSFVHRLFNMHMNIIVSESEFQEIQQKFLDNYWHIFSPEEENKLIYTEIFNQYNQEVENYIVKQLKKSVPNFSIATFLDQLNERRPELDGEVFEVLATLTDFLAFKEMLLDYKAVKEGKVEDFSSGISITSIKSMSSESNEPAG